MIDWDLATRIASFVAGSAAAPSLDADRLASICDEALAAVVGYTGMSPTAPVPRAEIVSRQQWAEANAASLGELVGPALAGLGGRSGRASDGARLLGEAAVTAEAGAALGLMSRKVLGQYDVPLVGDGDSVVPRLLFVAPNVEQAMASLGADGEEFLRWVAIHEVTHAVQFGSVPWLREHLGSMAVGLIGATESDQPTGRRSVGEVAGSLADRVARSVRGRDPLALALPPDRHELLGRLQATMSLVEGHAEHVMDRADPAGVPSVDRLRATMAARRRSPGPLWKILGKVLGLELKMKQYEQGRRFCDAVVETAGVGALNRAWDSPESLPGAAEIADPGAWLARIGE